jgi:hypothetical protein
MKQPGISVNEGSDPTALSIVDAFIVSETRWSCPRCKTRWSKPGIHTGVLKTCKKDGCGAKFFLRREED